MKRFKSILCTIVLFSAISINAITEDNTRIPMLEQGKAWTYIHHHFDYDGERYHETTTAVRTEFGRKNGIFEACITKSGYIPYPVLCDSTYLQNQLLNGSKTYETNYVIIGSDVTNKVPQGSVVINSGNTIVRAHQVATITKDFEVKAGAEFMITIE